MRERNLIFEILIVNFYINSRVYVFFFFRFYSFLVGVDAYNVGGYYYSMAFKLVKNEIQLSRRLGGREQRSDGAVACSFTNAAESATNLQHSCSRVYRPAGPTTRSIETTRLPVQTNFFFCVC